MVTRMHQLLKNIKEPKALVYTVNACFNSE